MCAPTNTMRHFMLFCKIFLNYIPVYFMGKRLWFLVNHNGFTLEGIGFLVSCERGLCSFAVGNKKKFWSNTEKK